MNFNKGKSNFKYIDGRCSKTYYCIDCNKIISYNNWKYGNRRCRSCAMKKRYKDNPKNNPGYIDNRTNKKYYCKCGNEICYMNWKYGQGKCRSCARKNKKFSKIWKIRIGKASKERLKNPKNHPMFGKIGAHGKGNYYKRIYMRSSYEIAYAKYLDKNNVKWLYESEVFDLGNMTYRPDFYLPKTNTYIEIKGWWRDKAKKKFKLFKQLYPNIKIVLLMKPELKKMGIKL